MDINQVLAQMRVMAAQAENTPKQVEEAGQSNFGDLLKNSIDQVNETQHEAKALTDVVQ
ncbi:MAG: hypothetical protein DIZ77_06530 [endosymbiont of Seepiophila jonesi]|uniref:Uncharacterized protein n=1 Tax=endosymbiont of Lamellibrachia luymesi TaxID=2200907 RepID=A0A370E120_9GAMM|nr:MAG: hypothetical protein DIZ77_06530 [endosymbiont of Seepiophila jonesi]RDH93183.1 MAG: hypothetical protein DIZ79_01450 [endosymbiont of Lamellibrachia luymesi]